jgi:hypothetical protein
MAAMAHDENGVVACNPFAGVAVLDQGVHGE